MIGQSIKHYQIIANLGQGNIGVVDHTTDTRLGREVALKILPKRLASQIIKWLQ